MFKLCIDEEGRVVRAQKLISSGNQEVDTLYCKEFLLWRFKGAMVSGKAAKSVHYVTVTLYR